MTVSQNKSPAKVVPVVETMPADLYTPLGVYLRLAANAGNSFLLESVEGGVNVARYSFIGAEPDKTVKIDSLTFLREHFAAATADVDPELPAFIGGAIGYLGFDCCDWFEPTLAGENAEYVAELMFYRSIVAFDHARQVIKIISLVFTDEAADETPLQKLYEAAREKNIGIKTVIESGNVVIPKNEGRENNSDTRSNWERSEFEAAVSKIKELISAGECYQAVLSQCFTRRTNASAISIYRAIRSINPSPYMFLLQFDDRAVVGASPEMLVRCENGLLEYRPIAGTRPRGKTSAEDDTLADEMRSDAKEVAEHLMLVDLGRNDLGRVAEYGTVEVKTLMNVEKYSHVQHLVSTLSAKLRNGLDRFDALAACFPAGTVSGAPKVRAIEIIRALEPTPRGVYAGAVGYFDYSGNMDTCIAIRTLVLENGVARIQAGAGIVADSVPELEFEETVNKAKVLLKAIDIAERGDI